MNSRRLIGASEATDGASYWLKPALRKGIVISVVSKADVTLLNFDVRFTFESGHSAARSGCPLRAVSGHQATRSPRLRGRVRMAAVVATSITCPPAMLTAVEFDHQAKL